ncbi:porin-like protein [Acinetobacter calcoaceticus]|uniref:Porin-like protein n=1 Tax=Acinetobacter calcoaceticus TaxID=471 RepID=A0A4V2R124_ACICA|nr:porin-like protein [Acinetobacter calcoaceticus]
MNDRDGDRMKIQSTTFALKTLTLALGLSAVTWTQAQANTEVDQLRDEVKALRGLIEQYAQQQATTSAQLQQTQQKLAVINQNAAAVQPAPSSATQVTSPKGLLSSIGTSINIYGNVRADMSYQVEGGTDQRLYNQISTVPLEGNQGHDRFKSTLAATRLGLDFKSNLANNEAIGGKLEVDFLGSGDSLRIRHAYLTYGDWLVGQTWSNFATPEYMPESVDALGYVGGSVKRTPQVQRRFNFNPSTQLVVALEDPKDGSSEMRIPALTTRLNHKFSDQLNVSLRGMVNEKRTTEDELTAWGVGLGAKFALTPSTTIKADYYHVKGDSSFVAWSNPGFVADQDKNIASGNEFDSISVGITQQFNPKWRGTLGYGYMKADNNKNYLQASSDLTKLNKELWQAWGNAFYSPIQPLSFGVEYVYGERQAFAKAVGGSDTGVDNRVSAVAIYNF